MKSLQGLPHSLRQLGKLEKVVLEQLQQLKEIPEEIGQLPALQSLELNYIIGTAAVVGLFRSLERLENLRKITIRYFNQGQLTSSHARESSFISSELEKLITREALIP